MDDVIVAAAQRVHDDDVSVDVRSVVIWVTAKNRAVLRVHKIQLAVDRAFEPVVADDQSGGAILQAVPAAARADRTKSVELKGDPARFRVIVVMKDAARVAIVIQITGLHQHVAGGCRIAGERKETVAAIVDDAVADGNIVAELQVDGRGRSRIGLNGPVRSREGVGLSRAANLQVFDYQVLRVNRGPIGKRHCRPTYLDYTPLLAVVDQLGPRRRAAPV